MLGGYYDNEGIYHDPNEGNVDAPAQVPTPTAAPAAANIRPFDGQFTAPTPRGLPGLPDLGNAPIPDLPNYQAPPAFRAPSIDEALVDPSYKWRRDQGAGVLERSAFAAGRGNDTGTADALIDYGQNAASQEWQNIYNRAFTDYQANVQSQYVDPYKFKYQAALDRNAPAMAAWAANADLKKLGYSTEAAWNQHANDMDYSNAWQKFLGDYNIWRDQNVDIPVSLA